jgi:predicted phosphodiesterase
MKAFISDIHANLEALCNVLEDVEKHSIDEIICLGDIVGYGADPVACIDQIMSKADVTILGNHDNALINGPEGFNPLAAEIIELTQKIMDHGQADEDNVPDSFEPKFYECPCENKKPNCMIMEHSEDSRWIFEKDLPVSIEAGNLLYVHGSPLDPVNEYVLPDKFERAWNPERLKYMFDKIDKLAFCGHSHIPCAITSDYRCVYPVDCDYRLSLDKNKKYIINAGSVGQPRDRDNRACYLLFDEERYTIEWRRIPYDIEAAMKNIEDMCGKENWCSVRLMLGK